MKIFYILVTVLLLISNLYSQTPGWHTLPNAPVTFGKLPDISFINAYTGWTISGAGIVYRTTNGGTGWDSTNPNVGSGFRSIGFFDANTGIIGTLAEFNLLYRTTNGGLNWTNITQSVQGTHVKGICGISILNSSTAFACGRYFCPANVIKTTDKGANWISFPVDSSLVRSLVDCYFWSSDSGMVVGGYSPDNVFSHGKAVVLTTSDGGLNWSRKFISGTAGWCWKICFINRHTGFVSSQPSSGQSAFILKTTDAGESWSVISLPPAVTDLEGMGFVNENTGWVGAFSLPTYETTNGGIEWHPAGWGTGLNRVRFISDTLAYATGITVYKYTREPIGIQPISIEIPKQFSLHQNYPNPFNPETKIRFEIPAGNDDRLSVQLIVYNALGQKVTTLVNQQLKSGVYEVNWNAIAYPSGIYFYKLKADGFTQTRKLVLLK